MSEEPRWGTEDDGFCKYCKPWHWPQKQAGIHLSAESSGHFWHSLEPFAIGDEILTTVGDVWLVTPSYLRVIALSKRGDDDHYSMCSCGAPEFSQRVLWTSEPPPLVFRDRILGDRCRVLTITSEVVPANSPIHGMYITNNTSKVLTVGVAGNIGPNAHVSISETPEREPWMTDDDYARFLQGHPA